MASTQEDFDAPRRAMLRQIAAKVVATVRRNENDHLRPRSTIDAAQTTPEQRNHWANADALSANAAYDPATRSKLRNRSRYETLNNSYLKGLVKGTTYDLVGTGPRPTLTIPGDDDGEIARSIEAKYALWARANRLAHTYRVMQASKTRDGEGLAILDSDPNATDPVQLALRLVETDQCTTPWSLTGDPLVTDGVRFDRLGKPVQYFFLKYHPGDSNGVLGMAVQDYETIPARYVLQWFSQDRAGQMRGIPELTPALPLFAQLRRYSQATLIAAEFAAMMAGVMKSTLPADNGAAPTIESWEQFELVRGALLTTPYGYEATQFKPEQPTTNFPEFERAKLNEAGRSVQAPLNVTTGNSSGYNFSSGRLDHLPYQRFAWVDREDFEIVVADPVFQAWATEALLIDGHLPANLPPLATWSVAWDWDGFDELDQNKSATADETRLRTLTGTLAGVLSQRDGSNWRKVVDQIAAEVAYCRARGVKHPSEAPAPPAPPTATEPVDPDKPEADEETEQPPPAKSRFHRNGFHRNGSLNGGHNT